MDFITLNYASTVFSLLTNGIINVAVSDTSNLLVSMISNSNNSCKFKKTIDKIDLYNKLIVIDDFFHNLPKKNFHKKSIANLLKSIHDIIIQIYNKLNDINSIINYHKTKYFHYFRQPSYKIEINQLILLTQILDTRFDLLLKIINTIKFL